MEYLTTRLLALRDPTPFVIKVGPVTSSNSQLQLLFIEPLSRFYFINDPNDFYNVINKIGITYHQAAVSPNGAPFRLEHIHPYTGVTHCYAFSDDFELARLLLDLRPLVIATHYTVLFN